MLEHRHLVLQIAHNLRRQVEASDVPEHRDQALEVAELRGRPVGVDAGHKGRRGGRAAQTVVQRGIHRPQPVREEGAVGGGGLVRGGRVLESEVPVHGAAGERVVPVKEGDDRQPLLRT